MKSYYLWYDQTPTYSQEEIDAFESPQALLNAMRYGELDRWSSMSPLVERTVFYEEGQYVNFGWFLLWDDQGRLRVAFRDHGSPAAEAGLERGAEIVTINGEPLAQILDDGRWNDVWGPNEEGYSLTFEVVDATGGSRQVTLEKSLVQMSTVHHTEVLDTTFGTVGYLVFNRFLGISEAELRTAFEGFRGAGVDELVLDLRYNPGGLNAVARTLASLIASPGVVSERFLLQDYNEQYPEFDRELLFQDELSALGLSRVAIITSLSTASASELVINGLNPFVDVALVGERTYGKPVGADTWSYCDWAITPITHASRNAVDEGNFYGGFAPDCPIPDDFDHAFGDPAEPRLSAALYWLEHGACPSD
jgi:carboxyl-terminal processing protease